MRKPLPAPDPLLRLQASITARDDRLLGWLYDHGLLTTDQIATALFPSLDFAQRRLRRLTVLRAVDRFRPNKPDGGSYPYHYVLDQLGYSHVHAQRGLGPPRRDQARRRKQSLTSRPDLPHLLGGNQVFIDLAAHARSHPNSRLDRWQPASAFHDPGVFYRKGGDPQIMARGPSGLPRPDGAGVWTEQDRAVPFFLEYDTGRERLDILTEKIAKYERLYAMSTWAWPVLFHLPSARREANLHHRLTGTTPRAFIATTTADLRAATSASPADQVWHLVGLGAGRRRLIDLPYNDTRHDQEFPSRSAARPHGRAS
ncbi:replication-relaxation family protein [Micromonospora halotolerans]|uniref:Replication-relaxation family protein n=1 Tax=Micromonospora halotolerans TaxID=709879 RepID=A0ABZ0A2P8_9ACTN|nr:replication-relaxation family protein [Micromonospora halotolerans]WNM40896.1 replication-relaxation family protein [Micromonospora halotolerans]